MGHCEIADIGEITRDIPLGPLIHRMDRIMFQKLNSRVRAEGLDEVTLMHGWIMRFLYMNRDKEICQRDIEHTFSIRRSSVTSIIQVMEKKGYIARESVSGDARLKRVMLTEKGIQSHLQVEHLIAELEGEQLQDITEEELDNFYLVMNKLKKNLKRIQEVGEEEKHASDNIKRSKRI